MAPRFVNPHLLPETLEPATRAELYSTNAEESLEFDESTVQELNKLLRKRVRYEIVPSQDVESVRSSKRRRLENEGPVDVLEEDAEEEEELVWRMPVFRLVSSSKDPRPVSLLPAPTPPTFARPPDSEDSEVHAILRKERAEAASIDGQIILRECIASQHPSVSPIVSMHLQKPMPDPPRIMVIETMKKDNRRTRPPVPPSKLLNFPYTENIPSSSASSLKTKCPVIEAVGTMSPPSAPVSRRSRHRRKSQTSTPKERPPPQFWRPGAGMSGKCRGYAYGYPSSFLAAAEARGYVNELSAQKYKHDTMKKGVYGQQSWV